MKRMNKPHRNILTSSAAVMATMLLSKLLGFVRQTVIGRTYGSTFETDIYFLSSNFMTNVSGAFTAALTTALVSVYILTREKEGRDSANRLASRVLTAFLLAASVLVLISLAGAPLIARIIAPGYEAEALDVLAKYLRIFSVTFLFAAFQSMIAAVLNACDRYVEGKLYGLIYNPIAIVFVMLLSGRYGTDALVFAFIIANILQILLLAFFARREFRIRISNPFGDGEVKRVIILALPLLLSNILVQLNSVIDSAICSLVGVGVASDYSYAYTLEQFVTGTLTATVTLILFTKFSTLAAADDKKSLTKSLSSSISVLSLIIAPICAVVIVAAYDITAVVYLRGEFTESAASITAMALAGFGAGLPFIAVRELLVKAHFACKDTKLPMIAGACSVALNAALSILLAKPLGVLGVTLATGLSAILSIAVLSKTVKKYLPEFRMSACAPALLKIALSASAAAAAAYAAGLLFTPGTLLSFVMRTAAAAAVYIPMLFILRVREVGVLRELVRDAVGKGKK